MTVIASLLQLHSKSHSSHYPPLEVGTGEQTEQDRTSQACGWPWGCQGGHLERGPAKAYDLAGTAGGKGSPGLPLAWGVGPDPA